MIFTFVLVKNITFYIEMPPAALNSLFKVEQKDSKIFSSGIYLMCH